MFVYLPTLRDSSYRESILSLLTVCDEHFFPPLSSSRLPFNKEADLQDKLRKYLEEKDLFHHYLLFLYDHEPIGLINFVITEDSIEVDTICVHPKHRNHGIAKEFYHYLFHSICPKYDFPFVSVECSKNATSHIHLLRKLGFILVQESSTHFLFTKKSA